MPGKGWNEEDRQLETSNAQKLKNKAALIGFEAASPSSEGAASGSAGMKCTPQKISMQS